MNKKENKGYQTTHKKIMDALLELLKEKNIKQITVAEICRMASINRSTFYEHFTDVYDVLNQIADTVRAEVLKKEAPKGQPSREDLLFLLRHFQNNREFYTLFFHQNLPLNIYEKFFMNKQPPLPPRTVLDARGIQNDVQLEYHRVFFQAGLDAILKKWLERDCAETPEELYDILKQEYV